jgi:vacuolar-type H+-ATPase subunit I/STV1
MAIPEDRLDRVERILVEMAERQAEIIERQANTEKLVESNARAILANTEAHNELRSELQEFIAIVREYVEVTNRRLNALEDTQ